MFKSKLLKAAAQGMTPGVLVKALKLLDKALGSIGDSTVVTITGGAAMVLQGMKPQTPDVDAISPAEPGITAALEAIEDQVGLPHDWFNFSAAGHLINEIPPEGLKELWKGEYLTLQGPKPEWLFFKKAESGRHQKDQDDVVRIVKALGWSTVEAERRYKMMSGGTPMPQNIYWHLAHYIS